MVTTEGSVTGIRSGTSPKPAKRRFTFRPAVAVLVAGSLASLCAGYYYWFFLRPAPRPASVLFASAGQIREIEAVIQDEPKDPKWRLRLGEAYVRDGHYLTAIETLNGALAQGAPETEVRKQLRICYLRLERPELAIRESQRLRELNPHDLWPVLSLAYAYLDADRRTDAVKVLATVQVDEQGRPLVGNESPEERQKRFQSFQGVEQRMRANDAEVLDEDPAQQRESLTTAFIRAGDWPRALELARKAIQYAPERVGGYVAAGQALTALGRTAETVALFKPLRLSGDFRYLSGTALLARAAPGDRAAAETEFEEAVRLTPTLGRAWAELAKLRAARGKWLAAAEAYSRADDYGAEKPRARRMASEAAERAGQHDLALQLRGSYFQESGQPDKALVVYRELLTRHADQEFAYRQVAGALGALNRKQERLAILLQAQKRFPESPDLVISLAGTYSDLNQAEAAFSVLRKAEAGFAKGNPQILSSLASALDSSGRLDDAEALYRRLIPLTPGVAGPRRALAKLLLDRRDDPKRLHEGIRLLEECVPMARDEASLYHQLGIAYSHAGRSQEAVWALRHAIDLSPGDGITYQPLGSLLQKLGRSEEGTDMLRLAERYREFRRVQSMLRVRASHTPPDPVAIRALGEFYYRAQAYGQAELEYQRLLKLSPHDAQVRSRLSEIYGMLGRTLDQSDLMNARPAREIGRS
jgi:Flp pilus assembly protein TadD